MSNKTLSYTLYQANAGKREVESETKFPHPVEVHDLESLRKAVEWQYSPAKLVNGIRSSENFESANVIVMDIDNEHSNNEQDWIKSENIKELFPDVFCYWETSRNHMREKKKKSGEIISPRPRFHVHFPLGEVVKNDPKEYKGLKTRVYDCYPDIFDRNDLAAVQMKYVSESAQVGIVEGSKTILEYLKEHEPQQKDLSIHSGEDTLLSEKLAPLEDLYKSKSEPKNDSKEKDLFIYNQAYYQYCLDCIDPCELSREEWLQVGMALKRLGMPWEMFFEWCMRDPDRVGDIEGEWNSFKSDLPEGKGFSGRTLTHMAIERVGESAFYKGLPAECWKTPSAKDLFEILDGSLDENGKKKKPTIQELGKIASEQLHAVYVPQEGLHIYSEEEGYTHREDEIKRAIHKLFKGSLNPQTVANIYKYLCNDAPEKSNAPEEYIQFNNVILDIKKGELVEKSPEHFIRTLIPHNYNPKAPRCEIVDKTFNEWACGDPLKVELLFQWIGYSLLRYTPIDCFMVFIGDKRNGKSQCCSYIRWLVGHENCSSVPMNDIGDKFAASFYYDKQANICDENQGKSLGENTFLKSTSAGGWINVEPKGKEAFSYKCVVKHTFSFNEDFRSKDYSGALKERMLVLKFNADFSDVSKQDKMLLHKLSQKEATEYTIKRAMDAVFEVLHKRNGKFTLPEDAQGFLDEQRRRDDPIWDFIQDVEAKEVTYRQDPYGWGEEIVVEDDFFTSHPLRKIIYPTFQNWYKETRGTTVGLCGERVFSKQLRRNLNLKTCYKKDKESKNRSNVTYFEPINAPSRIEEDEMYN